MAAGNSGEEQLAGTAFCVALLRNGQAASWKWEGGTSIGKREVTLKFWNLYPLSIPPTPPDFHMDEYRKFLLYLLLLSTVGGLICGPSYLL